MGGAVMEVLGMVVILVAAHRMFRRWNIRLDARLHALEREALDSSIRWSYWRGIRDAMEQRDPNVGCVYVVQEFRNKWGDDRRETWR